VKLAQGEGGVDALVMEYLIPSNQIHSFIATKATLNANLEVDQVVGILVQLLPDHTDEDIDFIEHKLGNSDYITDVLIKSFNYHSLLSEIVDDVEI
ncbi:molecular chaperone Hsp33, partial [Rhizobium sp. KAs_5_22]